MSTLLKALLWSCLLVVVLIGLPILIGLIGLIWPVLLIIALFVFVFILVGMLIQKNSEK